MKQVYFNHYFYWKTIILYIFFRFSVILRSKTRTLFVFLFLFPILYTDISFHYFIAKTNLTECAIIKTKTEEGQKRQWKKKVIKKNGNTD